MAARVVLALMVPGLTSGQMPTGWTYMPSRDAFDPTSPFISYIDLGLCGPKGDDARADLSPCRHGHYVVSSVPPNQNFDTIATIAGCEYAAYEMYACSAAPPGYQTTRRREFCMHRSNAAQAACHDHLQDPPGQCVADPNLQHTPSHSFVGCVPALAHFYQMVAEKGSR